jgi:hypothetical protein
VIVMAAAWLVPDTSAQARLKIFGGGAATAGYGIYVASQSSGIFFIPSYAIAVGLLVPVWLYRQLREQRRGRAVPTVPPGTPGGRTCLSCGRTYPADTTGACPWCRGTLALPSPTDQKE